MSPIGFGFGGRRSGFQFPAGSAQRLILAGIDPGQDCDDCAALALAIVRHKLGLCVLLLVTVSPDNTNAASVARLMLDYAGLTGIPVASRKAGGVSQSDYFDASLTSYYGYTQGKASYPDPAPTMRQALAASPDGSVVISCTGPIPDIYDLFQSAGDAYDSRGGQALVQSKVSRFGMIVGNYTGAATANGTNEYNLSFNNTQAKSVIDTLTAMPIDVYCCDGNLGQGTFCGPLDSSPAASNPLKNAFLLMSQSSNSASIVDQGGRLTRASWDVIVTDALLDLSAYTLDRGTMQFSTTNNASSWTRGPGNWCFLVPSVNTAGLQARYNAIFDSYDQGPTPPAKPTFTVSEASQGTVVVAPSFSFFTSFDYTTDNEATWTALPASGITTLTANTQYTIRLRGRRYGLTSPSSDPTTFTTKPVVTPTSIDTTPGVIRHSLFGTAGNITPTPASPYSTRMTQAADTCTPSKPWKTDLGPAYIQSSYFGKPALRGANGDSNSNLPGAFGRIYNDVAELAGYNSWFIVLSIAIDAGRNGQGSRAVSVISNGGQDYQAGGCLVQVPSGTLNVQAAAGGSTILYGTAAAVTRYAPNILTLICNNGSLQLRLNSTNIGSPVAMPALGTAPRVEFLREAGEDGAVLFADLLEATIGSGVPTAANLKFIESTQASNAGVTLAA